MLRLPSIAFDCLRLPSIAFDCLRLRRLPTARGVVQCAANRHPMVARRQPARTELKFRLDGLWGGSIDASDRSDGQGLSRREARAIAVSIVSPSEVSSVMSGPRPESSSDPIAQLSLGMLLVCLAAL